jgi:membrane-bound lytic murein transglycosylase B
VTLIFGWDRIKGVLMNRGSQFKLVTIAVLLALVWLPVKASAAQCGSTASGFEAWKRQFASEAQARGVSATAITALMTTNYSTATIAADRGQRSFSLSLNQFLAKRGGSTIVAAWASAKAIPCNALHINPATVRCGCRRRVGRN